MKKKSRTLIYEPAVLTLNLQTIITMGLPTNFTENNATFLQMQTILTHLSQEERFFKEYNNSQAPWALY